MLALDCEAIKEETVEETSESKDQKILRVETMNSLKMKAAELM